MCLIDFYGTSEGEKDDSLTSLLKKMDHILINVDWQSLITIWKLFFISAKDNTGTCFNPSVLKLQNKDIISDIAWISI